MNPWKWANREITYSNDMCNRTLEILARTCNVFLGARFPLPLVQLRAKKLLKSLS
jgi:hypothetical protein